ncbi:MAG: hypothetical protein QXW06_00890 [Thermoplasmata archaeon]
MAAPTGSFPSIGYHGLEKEDKAAKVRTYSSYTTGILGFVMLMVLLQSVATSGASFEPFHLPLEALLTPILLFLLLINIVVILFDSIELRVMKEPRHRVWRCEDFIANARPLAVVTIVLAFFFSNPILLGTIEDLSSKRGTESLDGKGDYRVRLYPSDFFDTSFISTLEASSDGGGIRVFVLEERDYGLLQDADFDLSNGSLLLRLKWCSPFENSTVSVDLRELALDFRDHAVVFYNPGNTTVTVSYTLANRVNRSLLDRFVTMCVVFFALNLAWAIAVYARKRAYIQEFIRREQQRLMRTYTIEEVFLIYRDGRLICHNSRRLKPDIDKDVLTGMLTAVQTFVKDSFAAEEKGALNQLNYGNLKILIENGPRANLAVVVSGNEPASLRPNMRALLDSIHKRYMPILDDWDGDITRLRELKKQIGLLIPEERLRPRTVVEEILVLYRDNRFMMHLSQRGQPDVDDTLLTNLLETVRTQVGEAMSSPGKEAVYEIPYGGWKVLIEYGVHIYLAVLISGPEPPDLRERMRKVLIDIGSAFDEELAKWDGSAELVLDLRPLIEELFVESLKKKKGKWF